MDRHELRRLDYSLASDHEALQAAYRDFFMTHCPIEVVRAAQETGFDEKLWQRLCAMGATTMALPESAGGPDALAEYQRALDEWRLLNASALVGLVEEALTIAAEFAKTRYTLGVPISTLQGISHPWPTSRSPCRVDAIWLGARPGSWTTNPTNARNWLPRPSCSWPRRRLGPRPRPCTCKAGSVFRPKPPRRRISCVPAAGRWPVETRVPAPSMSANLLPRARAGCSTRTSRTSKKGYSKTATPHRSAALGTLRPVSARGRTTKENRWPGAASTTLARAPSRPESVRCQPLRERSPYATRESR